MSSQQNTKSGEQVPGERRLQREDWIRAAWEILGEGNLNEIKVKSLATQLGVTRGSFYWHFQSRQELIDALLERLSGTEALLMGSHFAPPTAGRIEADGKGFRLRPPRAEEGVT